MRTAILCLALCISGGATAQQTQRPKKVLTPEQIALQQRMKVRNAELDRHRTAATTAYAAEMAREKAGDCPNASNTRDINQCLDREVGITEANYKAYTSALRAMLAPPSADEPSPQESGPTGQYATFATNAAAFDAAEAAWHTYAAAECNAIDTLWRGGTIVNSMVLGCSQRMTRARLHELDNAYDFSLHPH